MKEVLHRLFIHNWQRKAVAVVIAIIIWLIVDHSITAKKTFNEVPVRVINIPTGKTITGIQPGGILPQRMTLTLTGKKSILDYLDSADLEMIVDSAGKGNQWQVGATKRDLISAHPGFDVTSDITQLTNRPYVVTLSPLVLEKIPIYITPPTGEPPSGYQLVGVWPQKLYLTIEGSEEEVKKLQTRGLQLNLDLRGISKEELDSLQEKNVGEVTFYAPASWKRVKLPYYPYDEMEITDPAAELLRIDFVRTELIPLNISLPIVSFFPPSHSSKYNPKKIKGISGPFVDMKSDQYVLNAPLFLSHVSKSFLDVIKDHMWLVVEVSPNKLHQLNWSIQLVNVPALEQDYVRNLLSLRSDEKLQQMHPSFKENYLRSRFQSYVKNMSFFTSPSTLLEIEITLQEDFIDIQPKTIP